ncbi:MAG: trigger factor [Candidatus Portnoybacteria bacterium]|nr:trigger factor [Candidatus Portnoybacteria bacterium]
MKTDIKKIDNKVKINVEIPPLLVESYFKTAAEELSRNLEIKGFRPGKAPVNTVEEKVGSEKLYNQAANVAVQKSLPGIISKNDLDVVGQPQISIKKIAKGEPLVYEVIFDLVPEVELGKYKGVKVKKKKIDVDDEELDRSLEYLQNSRTQLITVEREAKKGDRVELDFEIKQGGVQIEDGESKNHPFVLGESRFVPGFEEKIEGMKAGEEKEFSLKIPDDWPDKRIAGKNVDFKVKVNLVQERKKPALNDDFAKSLGAFSSLDALKKNVKEGLLQEKENKEKERLRVAIIEKIADDSKVEIPDSLVEQEKEKMLNELKSNVANMGLDFGKYLEQIKKTEEELRKEWDDQARKRIKIGLCLREIAKKENVDVSDSEVEEKINEDLKQYPNPEEVKKKIDLEALKGYTRNILKNEKTFELLEKEAKIN